MICKIVVEVTTRQCSHLASTRCQDVTLEELNEAAELLSTVNSSANYRLPLKPRSQPTIRNPKLFRDCHRESASRKHFVGEICVTLAFTTSYLHTNDLKGFATSYRSSAVSFARSSSFYVRCNYRLGVLSQRSLQGTPRRQAADQTSRNRIPHRHSSRLLPCHPHTGPSQPSRSPLSLARRRQHPQRPKPPTRISPSPRKLPHSAQLIHRAEMYRPSLRRKKWNGKMRIC